MFPNNLKSSLLKVPKTLDHSIVIITGSDLRHKRFAYRIQKEFSSNVIAWFEVKKNIQQSKTLNKSPKSKSRIANKSPRRKRSKV